MNPDFVVTDFDLRDQTSQVLFADSALGSRRAARSFWENAAMFSSVTGASAKSFFLPMFAI